MVMPGRARRPSDEPRRRVAGAAARAGLDSTPASARSATSRRWYSSTSGFSSWSRAWISLRFSSRKSATCRPLLSPLNQAERGITVQRFSFAGEIRLARACCRKDCTASRARGRHHVARMDDLVEHVVALPGRELLLLAPRDGEALLSEEAFAQEEFLPYWAELWPSALALARIVARRPLTGRRVIELGCGLGLPAIAAALTGGRGLATDWSPDSVAMTARNAERNGVALDTAVFRWDAPPEPLGLPWPLVLASDVLYEARNVPLLLDLLPRLTAAS